MALVEKLPERYENVETLMNLLEIDDLSFYICCDLKLQNVIVGINAHGSTYPCAYCNGKKNDYSDAEPRTFGAIRELSRAFAAAQPKEQIPKNFYNCTNEPILNVPDDAKVLDVLVPAELHLCIGVTCKLIFKANKLAEQIGLGNDFVSVI